MAKTRSLNSLLNGKTANRCTSPPYRNCKMASTMANLWDILARIRRRNLKEQFDCLAKR